MIKLYATATRLAAPALRLMLIRRARRGKEIKSRLPERQGIEPTPRPPGKLLWIHAASVGETVSVLPVLSALPKHLTVLLTTGTVTSAKMLATRLPELGLQDRVLHRFVPLDVPAWAARFLDHWRPNAAAFVESEIWPNLLAAVDARAIPRTLLNARLSPRSFAHWERIPSLAKPLFAGFQNIHAQTQADADRLQSLGAPRAMLLGNLKFAAPILPVDPTTLESLKNTIGTRPTWLAASIHPEEDDAMIAVHKSLAQSHPNLLTILVPRHPERGPTIAAKSHPIPTTLRSQGQSPPQTTGIYIADTIGELGLLYRATGLTCVGKSLHAHGGQNPLEPARLACATAIGPNTENFLDIVATLRDAGALTQIRDTASLTTWLDTMLRNPEHRKSMGEAGRIASQKFADLPTQLANLLTSESQA